MSVGRILPTLQKSGNELSLAGAQRRRLGSVRLKASFEESLAASSLFPLRPTRTEVLQVNVGKKCNQTCRHCHVDAGPDRTEVMPRNVVERCMTILSETDIPTLDITGGAPELHPDFREMVVHARSLGRHVIDRCNLTILLLPNYASLADFLAEQGVEIISSLPHYRATTTDAQRGKGVFDESVEALQRLNKLGYGDADSGLVLNLVTNPVGAFLPAPQESLERNWKQQLSKRYGIRFNNLYTITNMPISRFLDWLEQTGNLEHYMTRLANAYNPVAAESVMCRNTLSIGWDGTLYDCDFNQMLEMPVDDSVGQSVFDFDLSALNKRTIAVGPHCFGCTAGAGSSCGGATT